MFADSTSHSQRQHSLIDCDAMCTSSAAGHAVSPIQDRVSSATPGKWRDAIVVAASVGGWIEVVTLSDDQTIMLWNHADLTGELLPGTPVSLHAVYDVLKTADAKHSVLRVRVGV